MGGHYFSNGIALNTIEDEVTECQLADIPDQGNTYAGIETWRNINAIDDIVEFLAGDTHPERSPFLQNAQTLCQRGIVTVACIRGNVAAGGVALAAACDNVWVSDRVTINPAYRAMGLHGSEFHSYVLFPRLYCYILLTLVRWSYVQRCGQEEAGEMLRSMLPISTQKSLSIGLVDHVFEWKPYEAPGVPSYAIRELIQRLFNRIANKTLKCAPWVDSPVSPLEVTEKDGRTPMLVDWMCANKQNYFAKNRSEWHNPPLLHYRNEELSHMLLDCFHPTRSLRYHDRRRAFIRKFKSDTTPTRYMTHLHDAPDPEDTEEFDYIGPWKRGSEWRFVNTLAPASLETSAWTPVPLFYDATRDFDDFLTVDGQIAQRKEIVKCIKQREASMSDADKFVPEMISSMSISTIGEMLRSPQTSPDLSVWLKVAETDDVEGSSIAPDKLTTVASPETEPIEYDETMHPCFFADPAMS